MKIAVTGSTGNIGRKLTDLLLDDGSHDIVLLARNPEKLSSEIGRGAIVAEGSLDDEKYVISATEGIDVLFWLNPPNFTSDDIRKYYQSLAGKAVAAVKANKIKHVVLLSSIGAHLDSGAGPINGSTDAEKIMRKDVSNLTILRPAFFMENFMMAMGSIAQADSVFMPTSGSTTLPMIATSDIAKAAFNAVTSAPPSGTRIVPLHGPKDYSFDEATNIIGDKLGRKVSFVQASSDQTRDALINMGASNHIADIMIEMYEGIDSGHIKAEIERNSESTTPTTFEEFVETLMFPALKSK